MECKGKKVKISLLQAMEAHWNVVPEIHTIRVSRFI
jgi:hypothetical protein